MIKQYSTLPFCLALCALLAIVAGSVMPHTTYTSEKHTFVHRIDANISHAAQKPIQYVGSFKDVCALISEKFHDWHEKNLYFSIDEHHKKMFLSVRVLTAAMPLSIISIIIYTNPQLLTYVWHMNYASITSSPFYNNITPAFIAKEIGKLSSFNQNCIMIGLEKGLQWLMGRKIAADACINPVTWFADKENHDFINYITAILLILLSWLYILYYVYTDAATRWKSIAKIVSLQIIIRYILYLASLQSELHNTSVADQTQNNIIQNPATVSSESSDTVPEEIKKELHEITENLKKLVELTEKNNTDQTV